MKPEEFDKEENKLRIRLREQVKSIKNKYNVNVMAISEEYEPGDSQELISARKECIGCRDKYEDDYENLKKELFNSFNEIETKNKELEKKLENKDNVNVDAPKVAKDDKVIESDLPRSRGTRNMMWKL